MKVISVKASRSYEVRIGSGILANAGSYISEIKPHATAAIISDSNVWPNYGCELQENLRQHGIHSVSFVFPAGEASKNIETYLQILNFLAEAKITRSDLVIALGGGVVGDISGFVAATYLRGITYVQIPTSLLAMVDSSVGGKTAIDLPAGKNLVGAFKQPALVLCDIDTLATLPGNLFLDGCAEIIKYGMLYDASLIDELQGSGPDFNRESVIAKCVGFKRDVVAEDEFDTGARQRLNFGHTLGHGIEARSNFTITHGCGVAAGMAIITKAAVHRELCDQSVYEILVSLLQRFSLPTETTFTAPQLFESALSDKKRNGGTVNLIVPRKIGQCDVLPLPIEELEAFIKVGL